MGFDKVFCIEDTVDYEETSVSGGAYVALKNKGSFPYSFEAGIKVGTKGSKDDHKMKVVIGADLTNDDTDGICLNPYIAMQLPEQKLGGYTISDKQKTERMNLFGDNSIFGGDRLCAPQGTVKRCLKDMTLKPEVPKALGIMGADVCLAFSSIIVSGEGGAFRLELSLGLLQEALFRAAVDKDCTKSNKGICRFWILTGSKNEEEATNKIVKLWVEVRDKLFDKDHVEFTKTLNLGKLIKTLVGGTDHRRLTHGDDHDSDDDIKEDGALCFGNCENYVQSQKVSDGSATVPVLIAYALTWTSALFALSV